MCESCLTELTGGRVPPTTMAMRYAAALVCEVYAQPWGGVGGPLHVFVEDMNLEDHWFEDPRHRADTLGKWVDEWAYGEDYDVDDMRRLCALTFDALAGLTEAERAVAVWHRDRILSWRTEDVPRTRNGRSRATSRTCPTDV